MAPYLTTDNDEEHTGGEQQENKTKLAATGLAQESLPHRPRHSVLPRVLQERSPNIQVDPFVQAQGPLLKRDIPCPYGRGRETQLTNKAGDFVLRHAHFYQLTPVQFRNYQLLCARALEVEKYRTYRSKDTGGKPKGNQNVWGHVREELFFKGQ